MEYNSKNLPERDLIVALADLLVAKGVFTTEEFLEEVKKHVDDANKKVEQYKKDNPGMAMFMDMMSGDFRKEGDDQEQ